MMSILTKLRSQLKKLIDPQAQKTYANFFKEPIKFYGIKTPAVQKLAKTYRKEIQHEDKQTIRAYCESLFASDYCEEAFIACERSYAMRKQYEEKDFLIFQQRIEKYINNRAKCDTFCNHTIGDFVEQFSSYITQLKQRTKSKNRRVKRAAAVSLIIPARRGKFLPDIFAIADSLLMDEDDMVQKWYGRMLKAASQAHQQEVFAYVMKHKAKMPRTSLRYAIEKMPKELKVQAMVK